MRHANAAPTRSFFQQMMKTVSQKRPKIRRSKQRVLPPHRESKAAADCSAATLPVNSHRWGPPFLWGFRCPGGAVLRLA